MLFVGHRYRAVDEGRGLQTQDKEEGDIIII